LQSKQINCIKMEEKCTAIIELLQSDVNPSDISRSLNCSQMMVYRTKNLFEASGGVKKRMTKEKTVRRSQMVRNVRSAITRNPVRNLSTLAKHYGTSRATILRLVKEDLGAKSRKRSVKHLITQGGKER